MGELGSGRNGTSSSTSHTDSARFLRDRPLLYDTPAVGAGGRNGRQNEQRNADSPHNHDCQKVYHICQNLHCAKTAVCGIMGTVEGGRSMTLCTKSLSASHRSGPRMPPPQTPAHRLGGDLISVDVSLRPWSSAPRSFVLFGSAEINPCGNDRIRKRDAAA